MKKILFPAFFIIYLIACTENKKTLPSQNSSEQTVLKFWSDDAKTRIETWVKEVTDSSSASYIPVADRIAVFDNDGTLWCEQPMYTQLLFAMDNMKALAATHPEFKKDSVLNGLLNNDLASLQNAGTAGILKLIFASHSNQTEDVFNETVNKWLLTAKDKRFGNFYKEMTYLPMLQLLEYLRMNNFKTFIVSGGGADFIRVFSEDVYGIPPYQVIGSYSDAKYELIDNRPVVTKTSGSPFNDDKTGKPVAIHRFIGKVPVFCAGNSDGDQAMMEYTTGSKYKSLCMIIHHTDAKREYQYDSASAIGHLEKALIEAKEKNWMIVDMKNDFKKIFSFQ